MLEGKIQRKLDLLLRFGSIFWSCARGGKDACNDEVEHKRHGVV